MESEQRKKVNKIIKSLDQIPTLPAVCAKINSLIANPKSTAQHLARMIEEDQALTSKVLRVVNSAFYGFPQRISTLTHSVVILGFNEIRNIVYSLSVIKLFGKSKNAESFNHDDMVMFDFFAHHWCHHYPPAQQQSDLICVCDTAV